MGGDPRQGRPGLRHSCWRKFLNLLTIKRLFRIFYFHTLSYTLEILHLRTLLALAAAPHLFLLLLLALVGCLQRETDIGSNAITGQPTETFVMDSLVGTLGATFFPLFTNGVGPSLEVGQARGYSPFLPSALIW